MVKASEEVMKLDKKEGKLTELVREYLDIKNAKYEVIKAEPDDTVVRIKGVSPFVEPGSIMIEKDNKKVIIEQLTKVCGISGRFHERNGVNLDTVIDRPGRILFKTYKDKKDLYIHTELEAKEPTFGMYIGGANTSVKMKDVLKEPSKIPDRDETFEVKCECDHGKLKCKGNVWHW